MYAGIPGRILYRMQPLILATAGKLSHWKCLPCMKAFCAVGIKHLAMGGHHGCARPLQVSIGNEMHWPDRSSFRVTQNHRSGAIRLGHCNGVMNCCLRGASAGFRHQVRLRKPYHIFRRQTDIPLTSAWKLRSCQRALMSRLESHCPI